MAFLDKNKGKTHSISKPEGLGHHGKTNSQQNVTAVGHSSTILTPMISNKNKSTLYHSESKASKKSKGEEMPEDKKSRASPFHITNPFYLDQLEKQKAQREQLERQVKARMEKQRKKKEEIQAKLRETGEEGNQKFKAKLWVPMGGLGPNIGTQQWNRKTQLHNKMLNFSKDIKKMNFSKIQCVPFMSVSHLQTGPRNDARSVAIEYSRGVPKPRLLAGQSIVTGLPITQEKEEINEMEKLEMNHFKYMQLMKNL